MYYIRTFKCIKLTCSRSSSSLYASRNEAVARAMTVKSNLDFSGVFKDVNKLKQNLISRGLNLEVNKLALDWECYQQLKNDFQVLKDKIGTVKKKTHSEYQNMQKDLDNLEPVVILQCLQIPNNLDEMTPQTNDVVDKVIYQNGSQPIFSFLPQSFLDIGQRNNLLKIKKIPFELFLINAASYLEISYLNYFAQVLQNDDYVQFSNPDLCRSVILEGTTQELISDQAYILEQKNGNIYSAMHLVGGSSLQAFCAYFTNSILTSSEFLPIKLFSIGKNYCPTRYRKDINESFCQDSCVDVFILCQDTTKYEYPKCLQKLTEFYKNYAFHYKLVQLHAKHLKSWESARCSLQMFFPSLNAYLEVAHISVINEFISNRLSIQYKNKNGRLNPLHMIHGRFLSFKALLSGYIESTQTENGKCEILPNINTP